MTPKSKILVTGMSGLIGGAVRKELENSYELSALNRSAVEGIPCHQADINDLDAIQPAFQGIDTVIHLAAIADMDAPWDSILQTNVIGTYNVFEAARQAGVKRVIYASSGATTAAWEREMPYKGLVEGDYDAVGDAWPMITHETPVRPNGLYGASKVWGEAIARHFTDTTDLSIICLRIGIVNEADQPQGSRAASAWCSQRDIAGMVKRCVIAPDELKFDIFYVVSNNRWNYRDLEHGRDVLGFEPQD